MFFQSSISERFRVEAHGEAISQNGLWAFIVAASLETKKIAAIYSITNKSYTLQDEHGVEVEITNVEKRNQFTGFLISIRNKAKQAETFELKNELIQTSFAFAKFIEAIKIKVSEMNNEDHSLVKKNHFKLTKSIARTQIKNGNFDFSGYLTIENFIAYQEAFFDLIETGEIFNLPYFNKKRKILIEQLPKNRLIDPCKHEDLNNVSISTTQAKSPEKILLNRAIRFCSDHLDSLGCWSFFDASSEFQYCVNSHMASALPVTGLKEKASFYLNKRGERVSDIVGDVSVKERVENAFKSIETPVFQRFSSTVDLNNFIKIFSRGRFLDRYVLADMPDLKKGENPFLMSVLFGDNAYLMNAEALYYCFRELVLFSEKHETFCITGYSDKIVIETDNGKQIALSAVTLDKTDVYNVEKMHRYACLFYPVDFDEVVLKFRKSLLRQQEAIPKKTKTIYKIQEFIEKEKQKELEQSISNSPVPYISEESQLQLFL